MSGHFFLVDFATFYFLYEDGEEVFPGGLGAKPPTIKKVNSVAYDTDDPHKHTSGLWFS